MLHYERVSKENQVAVTYKERTTLFSRDFLIGFSIALFLHLFFLFFFHIKELNILSSFPIAIPMHVESDVAASFGDLSLDTKTNEDFLKDTLEPPLGLLPPFFTLEFRSERQSEDPHPFPSWHTLQAAEWDELLFESVAPKREPAIFFQLSRGLSDKVPLPFELKPIPLEAQNQLVRFQVQVDDTTGTIFWIESIKNTGVAEIDNYAANLLKEMRFEPESDSFISDGEIEVHFHG